GGGGAVGGVPVGDVLDDCGDGLAPGEVLPQPGADAVQAVVAAAVQVDDDDLLLDRLVNHLRAVDPVATCPRHGWSPQRSTAGIGALGALERPGRLPDRWLFPLDPGPLRAARCQIPAGGPDTPASIGPPAARHQALLAVDTAQRIARGRCRERPFDP